MIMTKLDREIKKINTYFKNVRVVNGLPLDGKQTLLKMFYGHNHFFTVPWNYSNDDGFISFSIKTLKQGLFIPDSQS